MPLEGPDDPFPDSYRELEERARRAGHRSPELDSQRALFDYLRTGFAALCTLVDHLPQGALYYYDSDFSCTVWLLVGERTAFLAYDAFEDPEEIRVRAEQWQQALDTDGAEMPSVLHMNLGYAAREDPGSRAVAMSICFVGDWFAMIRLPYLVPKREQLPANWPESHRARIHELAATRTDAPPGHSA